MTNAEDLEKEASACITFNESKSHLPAPLPLEASTPDNASAADSEKMQESIEHNNNAELQPELTTMDPVSVPGSIGILDFGRLTTKAQLDQQVHRNWISLQSSGKCRKHTPAPKKLQTSPSCRNA